MGIDLARFKVVGMIVESCVEVDDGQHLGRRIVSWESVLSENLPLATMKSKVKLLAIIGSQRKNGNSYHLARAVLGSLPVSYRMVQLAEKNIGFCTLCERCKEGGDCILHDDFNEILRDMRNADGLVFSLPKYLFVGSKFLAFLERLDTLVHMRRHGGYERKLGKPGCELFHGKPFCIFLTSGTGHVEDEILKIVGEYIEALGLKPVVSDEMHRSGMIVKAGDVQGEVLHNKDAIEECRRVIVRMVDFIDKSKKS